MTRTNSSQEQNRVAIVIPYYHAELAAEESISYMRCISKLSSHPILLLVPENLPENKYPTDEQIQILKVNSDWLQSINSYNRMMMDIEFYELFEEYEYILIYQLDAFVIEDKLKEFCELGYDYIGAPWLHGMISSKHLDAGVRYVGNGGFSLRRVSAFLEVLKQRVVDIDTWTEDVFWSSCNSETFKVAPIEVALSFAFESQVRKCYEQNGYRMPFGCHAWMKYDLDFWKEHMRGDDNPLENIVSDCTPKDLVTDYIDNKFMVASTELIQKWLKQREIGKIYIFGVGNIGRRYSLPIANAKLNNYCYLDNNRTRWGQKLYDGDIVNPQVLKQEVCGRRLIIVAIKDYEEIYRQLDEMGINTQEEVITYIDFAKEINAIWS